jgi:type I restriction enzyme S subunit
MLDAKRFTGERPGRYLRNVDVQWDHVNVEDLPEMDFDLDERERFRLRVGDLLVCEGGEVGRTAVWRGELEECFYQKAVHRVRPRREGDVPRYLYYVLRLMAETGVFRADGNPNTIDHLTATQLRHYRVPFPTPFEQERIAAFLDRETAKIDALLSGEERLLRAVEEERRTRITRAVCGRLAELPADRWAGCMPEDWKLMRMRFLTTRIEQGWSPLCENRLADESEWGVLKVGCVNGGTFDEAEHKALPAGETPLPEYEIRPGDILMSRANTRELLGSAALVGSVRPRLLLCDKLYRLKVRGDLIVPAYLMLLLGTAPARFQLERESTGASGSMQNISQETLANMLVPLPPLQEQARVVELVRAETARMAEVVGRVRQAMERLVALRTALITAAVTGQIDVRQEVA